MNYKKMLKKYLVSAGIRHGERKINKVISYLDIVTEKNKVINLIGTKNKEDILARHIFDSLSLLSIYSGELGGRRIIDIGTGAGLPGIPLAIFLTESNIVLLDKTRKKTRFLKETAEELKLKNIEVITGRAEEISRERQYREKFDVVLARAVTKISILLELAIPFCIINGKIIFYKSKKVFDEIKDHNKVVSKLGGEFKNLYEVKVPELEGFRAFLVLRKIRKTPKKFPRNFAQIKRAPL